MHCSKRDFCLFAFQNIDRLDVNHSEDIYFRFFFWDFSEENLTRKGAEKSAKFQYCLYSFYAPNFFIKEDMKIVFPSKWKNRSRIVVRMFTIRYYIISRPNVVSFILMKINHVYYVCLPRDIHIQVFTKCD